MRTIKTYAGSGTASPSAMPPLRALIVEDNPHVRRLVTLLVQEAGFDVQSVESGDAARLLLEHSGLEVDLVITDLRMPGSSSGIDLALYCQSNFPEMRVLLSSGDTPAQLPDFSRRIDFISKPFSREELTSKISGLFAHPID